MKSLELYFSDKRNFLIVFKDRRERQVVVQKLSSKNESKDVISRSIVGSMVLDVVAQATNRAEQHLDGMIKKWQNREISNVRLHHLSVYRDKSVETDVETVCVLDVYQSAGKSYT